MDLEHCEHLLNSPSQILETESRSRKSTYYGLNLEQYNSRYGHISEDSKTSKNAVNDFISRCTGKNVARWIVKRIPVVDLFRTYKFRQYIVGDIIAGLSVGIVTIPQSLGYARLASVPAILGLYTSFFPVLVFFIFGSSRHVSLGIMALCSLVIAEAMKDIVVVPSNVTEEYNATSNGFTTLDMKKISVAMSISFLAGIFQVLMSIFNLGFIVSYMAEPFVSAYLAASNLKVLTHQVRDMLGVSSLEGYKGPGDYFYYVFGIFYNITEANLMQILISVLSLVTLILVKKFVNERFAAKMKAPIPIDVVVVIIFTVASHFGQFEERFSVKVLKTVPQGFPPVILPSVVYMKSHAFDAFMLAIVAYMMVAMMAKVFSQRHNYEVNNNQELFANGLSCIVGAFFCSMASSTSPPRCFLMETTGGFTQIAYLISALLVLLTMLFIAPLFYSLPVCVLSCIIFVACIPLFPHYLAWLTYWRTDKYDFAIWIVTAVINLLLPVDLGLLLGMGFSLALVNFRMQHPKTTNLSVNAEDQICLESKKYSKCENRKDVTIFRFESPLYFATLDTFKEQLFKTTVPVPFLKSMAGKADKKSAAKSGSLVDAKNIPLEVVQSNEQQEVVTENESILQNKPAANSCASDGVSDDNVIDAACISNVVITETMDPQNDWLLLTVIIIECSAIPFLDTSGAKLLAELHREYAKFGIKLLLAECCSSVVQRLRNVEQCQILFAESMYPSIQDVFVALSL